MKRLGNTDAITDAKRVATLIYPSGGGTGAAEHPPATMDATVASILSINASQVINTASPLAHGDLVTVDNASTLVALNAGAAGECLYSDGASPIWGMLAASNVEMDEIDTATYDDVQDWADVTQSAGRITGGSITDNSDGTVDVASGTGFIKATDAHVDDTKFFDWSAQANQGLDDDDKNWVYVKYNSGSPVVDATNTKADIDRNTEFAIARIWRSGSTLHILEKGQNIYNLGMRTERYLDDVFRYRRASGIITTESGSPRSVTITAGFIFRGLNQLTMSQFDSDPDGAGDTFTEVYRDGGVGWTEDSAASAVSNTQYDDGDGGLATIAPNQFGVFWAYMDFDRHVYIQYGQDSYKLAEAESASVPDTMPFLDEFALLIARIIVERNAANFASVAYPWDELFSFVNAADHNNLGNLQGGTAGEYYHLAASQYTPTHGDIYYGDDTPSMALLAIGASGEYLRSDGASPGWDTIHGEDLPDVGGTPSFTLSTTNAEGTAASFVRTDATVAVFDATVPTSIAPDDAAAAGAAAVAARRDHTHGIACAVVGTIVPDATPAEGTAGSFARSDHTHGIACASPAANLTATTTNAEGTAASFSRSDHSHAITTTSDGETNVSTILQSDANGYLRVARLGAGVAPTYQLDVSGSARIMGEIGLNTTPPTTFQVFLSGTLVGVSGTTDYQRGLGTSIAPDSDSWDGETTGHVAVGLTSDILSDANLKADKVLTALYGIAIGHGAHTGTVGTITSSVGLRIEGYYTAGTVTNAFDIYIATPQTGGTLSGAHYALYSANTGPSYFAGNVGIGGVPNASLDVLKADAVTNAITTVAILGHNTSDTAAALYGTGLTFQMESDGAVDRDAAQIATLWSAPTDATRNALLRMSTFPLGTAVGYFGLWSRADIADVERTVIPNGAGDVTAYIWIRYVVVESAGGVSSSVLAVAPGVDTDIYDDGTDVLQLSVKADGSVTLIRTAGAATFDVMLVMSWI